MRTTLTLDDDVAARLSRVQKAADKPFREIVNEALRRGLQQMTSNTSVTKRFETRSVDAGRLLISIDCASEALAIAEGEGYK